MLLNLCFALLGLYVAFLISTSADSLASTAIGRNACGFFSALLHYFMLAYFFWTAAEALFLFLKLVKVLRGSMNTYIYVAMAICWSKPSYIFFCTRIYAWMHICGSVLWIVSCKAYGI